MSFSGADAACEMEARLSSIQLPSDVFIDLTSVARASVRYPGVAFNRPAMDYMRIRWSKRWDPSRKVELTGKGGKDLIPPTDPNVLLEKLRRIEAGAKGGKDEKP